MKTLYLCYFGLREPLVQTQVLPYLRHLAKAGIDISLLTFEPQLRRRWTSASLKEQQALLASEGINWSYLPYHKRPSLPATLYDVLRGAWRTFYLARAGKIDVIHGRGALPTLMAMLTQRWTGCRLVFDMRGLNAEEYVDAGIWRDGSPTFRAFKWVERLSLRRAAQVVVLTNRIRDWLVEQRLKNPEQVEVIPCCVDYARFSRPGQADRERMRQELKLEGRRVIVYLGSLGGFYMTEEMARLLAVAHRQDSSTFSLILTHSQPEMIAAPLRQHGVAAGDFLVRRVSPEDVPLYLSAADFAVSFIKPTFSKRASSPTKLAEVLASGLPILSNTGIGDVDEVIERDGVGALVHEFNDEAYLRALMAIDELCRDPALAERCRESARRRFDLATVGGPRYCNVYRRIEDSTEAAQGKLGSSCGVLDREGTNRARI